MYEKLVNFAAKQLELDVDSITPDSTFESLGIDSLDIVEMIMDLETELAVNYETLHSVLSSSLILEFFSDKDIFMSLLDTII